MFAKLELELKSEEQISYQMSSLFHGVLMEQIDTEYADRLHESELHPFTSHLEYKNNKWYWIITVLNKEAFDQIITRFSNLESIRLEKKKMDVRIVQRNLIKKENEELANKFYNAECSKYIDIQIVTPMSFKQKGSYIFFPDIRLIYQSLMNKYDMVSDGQMHDEDLLEYLIEHTRIINYDIRSMNFSMEGIRVPGFIGKVTFKLSGPQTIVNFGNVLFEVGEFSGIGIKTAIGMGAVKIIRKEER